MTSVTPRSRSAYRYVRISGFRTQLLLQNDVYTTQPVAQPLVQPFASCNRTRSLSWREGGTLRGFKIRPTSPSGALRNWELMLVLVKNATG